ncbi:hypothetical protein [Aureimonas glaciei]|uniref:Uncharacterized protein n=1 Tax=Aureimonas glaciei TaxID=1776957 RepID=A0A916YF16_9HYPH|nr:hypothetical protein [Aureimonas glaciei]GGD42554.1 hypothetical protein GCM10011335_51570 [Aureimonas glaciei]
MSNEEAAMMIQRIIRNELDDCERAIKNDDPQKALSELDDAVRKLKRVVASLH